MGDVVTCLFADAGFDRAAQGLLGAARRLADDCGGQLRAVILGSKAAALAAQVAQIADEVVIADQPELAQYQPETCLNALHLICSHLGPQYVLLPSDSYSQEIAPRLAHRLGGSAVGDGVAIGVQAEALRVTRQVYGGKAHAVVEPKRYPAVVSLRARAFEPAAARPTASGITHTVLDIKPDTRTRIIERKQEGAGQVRLEDARVIVAGGRGIGGPEAFAAELGPLAQLLGAQMAASRAACDAGWVPPTWQVGQTGKKVAPDLYLAIAINGASQHVAGISEAKNIVAINIDAEAPIFNYCRFGMVADYRKVLPLLRAKISALGRSGVAMGQSAGA
jgi:electron transfer flavoprotein alpha subunit